MKDGPGLTAIERITAFVAEAKIAPDDATRETARAALVDTMGCILADVGQPVARQARAAVADWGTGPAAVYGTGLRLAAPWAALANAVAGHASDFDDWEVPGNTHPTVVLVPALLAAAGAGPVSGSAVLEAYLAGFEVITRLGEGMNFEHYDRGWHSTATLGAPGAAAAVSRLLGLDRRRTAAALSLALSQATGYTCQFGSAAKPLQAGFAAKAGLVAAQLAAHGLTGQSHVLDAPTGFNALTGHGDNARLAVALDRLGQKLALAEHGLVFKPMPSCGYTHRLVDCAIEIAARPGFRAEAVAGIEASLPDFHAAILPFHLPTSRAEALFSAPFCVAWALAHGRLTLADLDAEPWRDPEAARLTALTRLHIRTPRNPALNYDADDPDWLAVRMTDGTVHRADCAFPLGAPQNPLPFAMIRDKFHANAALGGAAGRPSFDAAAAALMRWDRAADLVAVVNQFGDSP
jgi:2-methylcitrate dehydratase PrpD